MAKIMDKSYLYNYASQALNRARDLQSQISQIDLDIRFQQLSNHSSFAGVSDSLRLNYLQSQKLNLISQRDSYVSDATSYAIELLLDEMNHDVSGYLSLGAMLINNIQSFLSVYDINARISVVARYKLAELSYKLAVPSFSYMDVATKVENLKRRLI